MRNYFFLTILLLFLSSINCFSQDTIIKRTGERVIAKVIEINTKEIKYKFYNYLDGPTYTENKTAIELIIFSNGVKEHFDINVNETPTATIVEDKAGIIINGKTFVRKDKITPYGKTRWEYENKLYFEKPLLKVLAETKDTVILKLIAESKEKKKLQYIGFAAIPFSIAAVAFGAGSQERGYYFDNAAIFGTCSVICSLVALGSIGYDIYISQQRRNLVNKAIKIYNQKY